MINLHPLYSSSSGNMFHLETDKTDILIDAGVTYKAMNEGLKSINKSMQDISAVLITHEHIDHIKGIPLFCRKNDHIPIYACGKTADYLQELLEEKNIEGNIQKISYGKSFKIRDLEIMPFETSHDAIMPCGFHIKNKETTLGYATDLGYVSNEVLEYLQDSNYVVLESNYDNTMLDFGKYPYPLKRRIKSVTGHLSNEDCAHTMARLCKHGISHFLLAHLSTNNNNQDIAQNTIVDVLQSCDVDPNSLQFDFASKLLSSEGYSLC